MLTKIKFMRYINTLKLQNDIITTVDVPDVVNNIITHNVSTRPIRLSKLAADKNRLTVKLITRFNFDVGRPTYKPVQLDTYIKGIRNQYKTARIVKSLDFIDGGNIELDYTPALDSIFYKNARTRARDKANQILLTVIDSISAANASKQLNTIAINPPQTIHTFSRNEIELMMSDPKLANRKLKNSADFMYLELMIYAKGLHSVFDGLTDKQAANTIILFTTATGNFAYDLLTFKYLSNKDTKIKNIFKECGIKADKLFSVGDSKVIPHLLTLASIISKHEEEPEVETTAEAIVEADEEVTEEESLAVAKSIEFELKQEKAPKLPTGTVDEAATQLLKDTILTKAAEARVGKLVDKYKELDKKLPSKVTKEELVIKPRKINVKAVVKIPGYEDDTLYSLDKEYLDNIMPKHIIASIKRLGNVGIMPTSIETKRISDVTGEKDEWTIKIEPLDGAVSTVRTLFPVATRDGMVKINGTDNMLKRLKSDKPIVKTAPDTVILTTAYGKLFVRRDERFTSNRDKYIANMLRKDSNAVVVPVISYKGTELYPKSFTGLALAFSLVNINGYTLEFGDPQWVTVGKKQYLACGTKGKSVVVVDMDNNWYTLTGNELTLVGDVIDVLGLDRAKVPTPSAIMPIFGVKIPVGIILTYYLGLPKLIKLLKCDIETVPAKGPGSNKKFEGNNITLKFKDVTLVIKNPDYKQELIFGGFRAFAKAMVLADYNTFKEHGKEATGLTFILDNDLIAKSNIIPIVKLHKELMLMLGMFIDPISESLLESMKEPTELLPLIVKAVEYLTDDTYPEPMDAANMVIKGFDRLVWIFYSELVKSARVYKNKFESGKQKYELKTFASWTRIVTEGILEPASTTNPIEALKGKSTVTFGGAFGRDSKTLTAKFKQYSVNDFGVIGDSTVDKADAGASVQLSAVPKLTTVLGDHKGIKNANDAPASAVGVTTLNSPMIEFDDPKRMNFAAIHDKHMWPIEGHPPLIRSGYEPYLARRKVADNMFTAVVDKPGKVTKVTKNFVEVTYKDKTKEKFSLISRVGSLSGKKMKHDHTTDLKVGDKVDTDDVITHTKFFKKPKWEPDYTTSASILVNVALLETKSTWEDASAISRKVADKLKITHVVEKIIEVKSTDTLVDPKVIGDKVGYSDTLVTVSQGLGDVSELGDEALELMGAMDNISHPVGYDGTVLDYEVYYTGSLDDMSPSVRALVEKVEARVKVVRTSNEEPYHKGLVPVGHRVKYMTMGENTIIFKYMIDVPLEHGSADKVEFGYMLKSITATVLPNNYRTVDGREVGALFGVRSIMDRVTMSPFKMMANTILLEASKQIKAEYNK